MDLKEGYIQTDLGFIPDDWEVCRLEELIDLLTDYESNGSFASLAENVNPVNHVSFAWYVRATDIENDTPISNLRYVDESSYRFLKKTSLFGGELLFLKKGDVGRVYLFKLKTRYATLADNLYLIKLNNKSNSVFLYNYFKSKIGQNQIKSKVAASSIAALYKDEVKAILVPLPTIEEQTAIATALSDVDALIDCLEKLIAKKRNIKQGTMQKLLQPKEGWEVKKLGEIAEMYSGGTPLTSNANYYNGSIPWVVIADITKAGKYIYETEKTISNEGVVNSSAKLFKKGILLFAMYASIGKTTIAMMDTACNQAILGIKTHSIDTEYLYYFLSFNETKFATMGQTGTQSNLSKDMVQKIDVPLPVNKEEQIRIATIFSDMDAEIQVLETKLEKYRNIKLGMMQNLLTGNIRLI